MCFETPEKFCHRHLLARFIGERTAQAVRELDSDVHVEPAYLQAANVKGLQQFVVLWCETVLKGFEAQGLKMPPEDKYYSDPR